MDNLTSITIYGSGANFNLGQSNNANDAWPRMVRFFKQYLVQKPMAAEVG